MRAYRQRKKLESKERLAKQLKEARIEREKELLSSMNDSALEMVKANQFLREQRIIDKNKEDTIDIQYIENIKELEAANPTYEQFKEWIDDRYANEEFSYWHCPCPAINFILERRCHSCNSLRPDTQDYREEDFLEIFSFASKWVKED